ncbi:hypothetical protein, partial [Sphingomonas sp.]
MGVGNNSVRQASHSRSQSPDQITLGGVFGTPDKRWINICQHFASGGRSVGCYHSDASRSRSICDFGQMAQLDAAWCAP